MNAQDSYKWRKQLMWGLALIAVGVTVFLVNLGLIEIHGIWHYWPLLLIASGVNSMIGYLTAKDFTDGLWQVLIGLWLFVVFNNEFGMTIRNSWPLPVIVCGITMVLEPLIKRYVASNEEPRNEK